MVKQTNWTNHYYRDDDDSIEEHCVNDIWSEQDQVIPKFHPSWNFLYQVGMDEYELHELAVDYWFNFHSDLETRYQLDPSLLQSYRERWLSINCPEGINLTYLHRFNLGNYQTALYRAFSWQLSK